MNELDLYRHKINEIDQKMRELFSERMAVCKEIGKYKKATGKPVKDLKREEEVICKNTAELQDPELAPYYREFIQKTMDLSCRYQGGSYVVFDSLSHISAYMAGEEKILLLTDEGIPKDYVNEVAGSLNNCIVVTLPSGEESKSLDNYRDIIKILMEEGFTREDGILSLGGGMVSDMGGFVAATYMRGISHYILPTTLLAMADAAIGGKCALNFNKVKNYIGVFKEPDRVLIDLKVLNTLSEREYRAGLAEIIKIGAALDKDLFEELENSEDKPDIEKILKRSIRLKLDITERDYLDSGLRNVLNFGHTLGHGIEATTDLNHGESVAVGMMYLSRGKAKERIEKVLKKYGLPTCTPIDPKKLRAFLEKDKKREKNGYKVIRVKTIGEYYTEVVSIDQLMSFLE